MTYVKAESSIIFCFATHNMTANGHADEVIEKRGKLLLRRLLMARCCIRRIAATTVPIGGIADKRQTEG